MTPKLLKADDVREMFDRWIRQAFYEREKIAAQMFHGMLDALPAVLPEGPAWQPIDSELLATLPKAVSPESPHARNMLALRLKYKELNFHDDLMSQKMSDWPESLYQHVSAVTKRLGICGDVIAQAVADWIRRPLPSPPAQATAEKETP